MMGSSYGESDEKPVHQVLLSDFSICKYEVTQAQWRAVMGNNPSYFSGCENCPVENVSWNEVQEFLAQLNNQTGKNYRLPTEAEWEYAARGGIQSRGFTYCGSDDILQVAWCDANSSNQTHPIGHKQANELGIYDMTGNVLEWCSDWYGNYISSSRSNPLGATIGKDRVIRGGGSRYEPSFCRLAFRNSHDPGYGSRDLGFRFVLAPAR